MGMLLQGQKMGRLAVIAVREQAELQIANKLASFKIDDRLQKMTARKSVRRDRHKLLT